MIINHNVNARFAARVSALAGDSQGRAAERLVTALRVNRTADDPSQLGFEAQIRGLAQASRNASNGVSFIQTAEGFLQQTQAVIHRMRELAVAAAHGVFSDADRLLIQIEVSQLVDEVDRIASTAQFNGMNLLTGRFAREGGAASMWFHIGANMDQRERVFIGDMSAAALNLRGAGGVVSVERQDGANIAIGLFDLALDALSRQRADLGAFQNRFEHVITGVNLSGENFTAANSRIEDADMASESVRYVRYGILSQAGEAMLVHSNQRPQSVLQILLGG